MTTKDIAGVCAVCGQAVRNRQPYTYVEAIVWERLGSHGSSRKVTSRKTTGRVVCAGCTPEADGTALTMFDV